MHETDRRRLRNGRRPIIQDRAGSALKRRGRGDGRPTIADVAARAGVGAITVSRALRNPALVSEELRRNIDAAVRDLNYIPDLNARALASHRTDVIGVLVPSLSHTLFTDVLRGIADGVDGTAFQLQIGNTRYDADEEKRLIESFLRQKPAAMIVSGTDQNDAARRLLEQAGCPVVQIMDLCADPVDLVIGFSHEDGGRRMTRHLIDQGYRRIAFISGWLNARSGGRLRGYQTALAEAGLSEPCAIHSMPPDELSAIAVASSPGELPILDYSPPSLGRALFRRALAEAPDLDAVFCNNDSLALGVLFECLEQGIRVPQDMGVAGFNDLDFTNATYPALSSARTPRYRIGQSAVDAIRGSLTGQRPKERIVDLGVQIIQRGSTDRHGTVAGPGTKRHLRRHWRSLGG